MAKEAWTVLFDVKKAGSMEPALWAEKKLKVQNGALETKEKNAGLATATPGAIKTVDVQECKFVTIEAESAEEAVLAVKKYYGSGGKTAAEAKQLETTTAALTGPQINNFTGINKWVGLNWKGAGENTTTEVTVT